MGEDLGELHLDVTQIVRWRTQPSHLFIHMMQFLKTGKHAVFTTFLRPFVKMPLNKTLNPESLQWIHTWVF